MIPTQPVWCDVAVPRHPPFPGGTVRADVAIVGGGLTGLSAAYHLLACHPGLRVVVLEADTLGAGASGRSTGMLSPGVGQSLVSLVRRHGPAMAERLYRASLQAVEDVCTLIAAESIDCELEMSGQLVVARGWDGRRRLVRQAALLKQMCLPVEVLDDSDLQSCLRLGPGVVARGEGPAALRLPRAGILHPLRLLAGLAERVTSRGGVIFERARVRHIHRGQPVRLTLDGGEVCAGEVVLAAAGYTPGLGLLRGRILPLHLQALATEPLDGAALGWSGREGVVDSRRLFSYFRRTVDNRIVFGGGRPRNHGGSAACALDDLAAELRRTFGISPRIAHAWTGVIDYTLDALPAIGRLPGRPHVLHVGGWCGHGIALGVAAGKWVASLLGGQAQEELPWFRAQPPGLPLEVVRRLAFAASVRMMAWLDG